MVWGVDSWFWGGFAAAVGLCSIFFFFTCIMVSKAVGGGYLVLLASELAMDLVLFISTGHFGQAMRRLSCIEFCRNAL